MSDLIVWARLDRLLSAEFRELSLASRGGTGTKVSVVTTSDADCR